eukprot:gnl/TRDRNA2_/TRDRNA2_152311_c2_seq2.p1 gnl/TRDRNA2_/TRDRNA2_152311_c2~~gnl/TRDRNA2_/TRDRNA2_152311_c2_seq2.p1  ORF type:complete len:1616 (+),score=224.25 gnl/TRDRNA2_/TRDRNA2_152311_c2_seq2:71-4918(+)
MHDNGPCQSSGTMATPASPHSASTSSLPALPKLDLAQVNATVGSVPSAAVSSNGSVQRPQAQQRRSRANSTKMPPRPMGGTPTSRAAAAPRPAAVAVCSPRAAEANTVDDDGGHRRSPSSDCTHGPGKEVDGLARAKSLDVFYKQATCIITGAASEAPQSRPDKPAPPKTPQGPSMPKGSPRPPASRAPGFTASLGPYRAPTQSPASASRSPRFIGGIGDAAQAAPEIAEPTGVPSPTENSRESLSTEGVQVSSESGPSSRASISAHKAVPPEGMPTRRSSLRRPAPPELLARRGEASAPRAHHSSREPPTPCETKVPSRPSAAASVQTTQASAPEPPVRTPSRPRRHEQRPQSARNYNTRTYGKDELPSFAATYGVKSLEVMSARADSRVAETGRSLKEREALEVALKGMKLSKPESIAIYLQRSQHPSSSKVFVLDGPDDHIRQALQRRLDWVENPVPASMFWSLKWCTTDCEDDYQSLQDGDLYNHFQNNRELTTKVGLLRSLQQLAVDEQVDIDSFFPRCYDMGVVSEREDFVLDFRRSAALKVALQHTRLCAAVRTHGTLGGASSADFSCNVNTLRTAVRALEQWIQDLEGVVIDEDAGHRRLPINDEEWDALVLYSELSDSQLRREEDDDDERRRTRNRGYSASGGTVEKLGGSSSRRGAHRPAVPQDWEEFRGHYWSTEPPIVLGNSLSAAITSLQAHWPQLGLQGPLNAWIVKPGTNSKGSGISCMQSLPEILHHCKTVVNRVVQKYIERPLLLFSGRKFDIRQWVFVRSFEPLEAYMFSDCYLRLCNEPFDLGDLSNRQRHISNWSVNKHGKHVAEGAVASLDEFRTELREITGCDDYWETQMRPGVERIVLNCLRAVQHSVVQRPSCFEVYGFDLMVDEDLRPWLLEVNLSPACEARTPWISTMLERMASSLLAILLGGQQTESDDWVRIGGSQAVSPSSVSAAADDAVPTARSCGGGETFRSQAAELVVVGRPLHLRTERRLEGAWHRQEAHLLLQRVGRGFLARRVAWHRRSMNLARAGQRLFRGRRGRQQATSRRRLLAVQEIARHARVYAARLAIVHFTWERRAIALQRRRRGVLGRRRMVLCRRIFAAASIQKRWRAWKARRRFRAVVKDMQRRNKAALKLQAAVRKAQAVRSYARLRHHVAKPARTLALVVAMARWRWQAYLFNVNEAARTLQSAWRRRLMREAERLALLRAIAGSWHQLVKVEVCAALSLQRCWRGHIGRLHAAERRAACDRLRAAVTVQRCWRGQRGRRRAGQLRAALVRLQAELRVCMARLWCWRQMCDRSTLTIQSCWRGHRARGVASARKTATTVLQAAWRGYLARKTVRKLRLHAAAVRIQALYRGEQGRKHAAELVMRTWSAVILQSAWRGLQARREARRRRKFAERRRRWLAAEGPRAVPLNEDQHARRRRKAFRRAQAALRIQTVWRGVLARRLCLRLARVAHRSAFCCSPPSPGTTCSPVSSPATSTPPSEETPVAAAPGFGGDDVRGGDFISAATADVTPVDSPLIATGQLTHATQEELEARMSTSPTQLPDESEAPTGAWRLDAADREAMLLGFQSALRLPLQALRAQGISDMLLDPPAPLSARGDPNSRPLRVPTS